METVYFASCATMEDLKWLAEQPHHLLEPDGDQTVQYYFRDKRKGGTPEGTVGIVYEGGDMPTDAPLFTPEDVETLRSMLTKFADARSSTDEEI